MKKNILFALILLLITFSETVAQGFQTPSEGNAMVYFVRLSRKGMIPTDIFKDQQIAGQLKRKAYMYKEIEAGQCLLWASAENKRFLQCNFEAGKTYIINVIPKFGWLSGVVVLEPISYSHKDFKKAKKTINKKEPMQTSQETKYNIMNELAKRGFIEDIMQKYEADYKDDKKTTSQLTPDMFIPDEYFN